MKILIIEDDPGIASVVSRAVESAGYESRVEPRGDSGLEEALKGGYDLIILDVMLPGLNGVEIASRLRAKGTTIPVLMLTARTEVENRIEGLDAGADDYLPKPFDVQELLARVRAQLRREHVHRARVIRVGGLEIDSVKHTVHRDGAEISLSKREFDLLEALASNEGRVLTREVIQGSVWKDSDGFSNTVDVYVGLLRKKIDGQFEKKLIHTIRNVGYSLEDKGQP